MKMKWYRYPRYRWRLRSKPKIWGFAGSRDDRYSAIRAMTSRKINRIAIFAGNRVTSSTLDLPTVRGTIEWAHRYGMPVILCRGLWETKPSNNTRLGTLVDWAYYAEQIAMLKAEAKKIGAQFTMFDTEAYSASPITEVARRLRAGQEHHNRQWWLEIRYAVTRAVRQSGPVDFVLPCGSLTRKWHPYEAIAAIAKQRISDGTYYNRPPINNNLVLYSDPYQFDITGMYVAPDPLDTIGHMPLFSADEVFGLWAYLWQRKHGLFIWPKEYGAGRVANTLYRVRK